MTSSRLSVFFACTVFTLQVYAHALSCNVPSKFWCGSEELAVACGVYDQCRKFEWTLRQDAKPVDFTLYYESLCPDCKKFITEMLYPTYLKVPGIVNLTLVPYGNANEKQVGSHWEFNCQHGPDECLGNIIETCTIALVKNIAVYLPFINCMEGSSLNPKGAAQKCAAHFPVPLEAIFNCSMSDYGNQLEHEMAVKTAALVPKHEYVPWVTLNGVHTEDIEQEAETNLLKLLCETYTGEKPPACSQSGVSKGMSHHMYNNLVFEEQ